MVRTYWDRLTTPLKMIYALCGWVFLFVLVHGTYTYRVNHQRAFAKAVETRIGIATIRVRAKSDVMIYEGTATPEQAAYAERIGQNFILRYGPSAVNPPTEIRNALQIRQLRLPRTAKLTHVAPAPRAPAKLAQRVAWNGRYARRR